MALKMGGGKAVPPKTGTDYTEHLGFAAQKSKPVTGIVTKEQTVSGKTIAGGTSETSTLHPGVFTNGMSITVEGGRTLNLGNYESARIGVHITVPCDNDSLNEAYEYATNWVSEKIDEAVKIAKGE